MASALPPASAPESPNKICSASASAGETEESTPKLSTRRTSRIPAFPSWREVKERVTRLVKRRMESNPDRKIKKQGLVKYLEFAEGDFEPKTDKHDNVLWTKARLLLVERRFGHVLEFYSPLQSEEPLTGLICSVIEEASICTGVDPNTFLLQVMGRVAFFIKAGNHKDMTSWLTILWLVMAQESNKNKGQAPIRPNSIKIIVTDDEGESNECSLEERKSIAPANFDPYQRRVSHIPVESPRIINRLPTNKAFTYPFRSDRPGASILDQLWKEYLPPSANTGISLLWKSMDTHLQRERRERLLASLRYYGWFHGELSRSAAKDMVLNARDADHGTFLIRQSKALNGEFCMTINVHGNAQHLPFVITWDGKCRLYISMARMGQYQEYTSMEGMMNYFRYYRLYLESSTQEEQIQIPMFLTRFVVGPGFYPYPLHST